MLTVSPLFEGQQGIIQQDNMFRHFYYYLMLQTWITPLNTLYKHDYVTSLPNQIAIYGANTHQLQYCIYDNLNSFQISLLNI